MTAKEFVLSKYPNAFCRAIRYPPSKIVNYQVHLTENGKILSTQPKENSAWASAKRVIIHKEKLAQVKSKV